MTAIPFSHAGKFLAAILFGFVFDTLGVPAAWFSGAMAGTIVWGLLGFKRLLPRPFIDAAMLVSGVVMGAAITPEAMAAAATYPLSILLLAMSVATVTATSAVFLIRFHGWTRDDAVLASLPGALTAVVAVGLSRNADTTRILAVQAFRLLVLIAVLPFAASFATGGATEFEAAAAPPGLATPHAFILMIGAGLVLGLLFERWRVAAPLLLGGTVASSFLHLTELAPGTVAPEVASAAFMTIGILIGERVCSIDRASLPALYRAALGSFVIGLGVSVFFACLAVLIVGIDFAVALVAFSPGAVESMIVLALVLGLEPLYVGVHHIVRFIGIGFALPLLFPAEKQHKVGDENLR
ncbi:MAG: AbrB family transcriptional regulator [Salinarimonadaceae bacterium]|nr:MAG: AbrB family transcriptional regulator [Salinarimonadaceae bacterium]